jgi:CO dehydrogenase/acetyl-CoA synthase epsilon subunit
VPECNAQSQAFYAAFLLASSFKKAKNPLVILDGLMRANYEHSMKVENGFKQRIMSLPEEFTTQGERNVGAHLKT